MSHLAYDLSVQITQIYDEHNVSLLRATEVENNEFKVYSSEPCKFHWTAFAKRNDIETEPYKNNVIIKGEGPYKWI